MIKKCEKYKILLMRFLLSVVLVLLLVVPGHSATLYSLFRNASSKNDNFNILLRLAKSGNAEAEYLVGLMYEIGKGVKVNYKKAAEWYKKAANSGYPRAQYNLAFMYRYGYGVKKNLILSYKWFYILGDKYEYEFDAQMMTPEEIEKAKKLAMSWLSSRSK